jgi:intein/homing endonuclease
MDGKEILVLGGTGSLGRMLVKAIKNKYNPRGIRIFSRTEFLQWEFEQELKILGLLDKVAFLIGDVRDKDRLSRAMNGVDIVLNCAAMKQVPACEYNPFEAIKTNIYGSQNIIDCAIDNKVKKVLHVSTDKACIDYHTRIETDKGIFSIRDIVKNKMQLKVKSFDGEKFVYKNVINWYKNKLSNRELYKIVTKYAISGSQRTVRRLIATEDHPILTERGYVNVKDLTKNDLVYTDIKIPNNSQTQMLIGTLLGDSGIYKRESNVKNLITDRYYIKLGHSIDQLDWLELKKESLSGINTGLIRESISQNKKPFYSLILSPTPFYETLYYKFYDKKSRVIPKELLEKYFSPLMMSTWFIDDGCNSAKDGLLRLATHRYSKKDVDWLKEFFTKKGFECINYQCKYKDKIYSEIRFTVKGSKELSKYISEYMPDKYQYKIREESRKKFDKTKWNLGEADFFKDTVKIEKYKYKTTRDVYCIDVEDTHNFVANGIVIHNCMPVNLYGMTKAVAENLFINGNVYTGGHNTIFSCVRYGNVLNSRGSILPLFKEQSKHGFITITDDRMTRFLITLETVVAFIMESIEEMQGAEIFIPKMISRKITDLANEVAPGIEQRITGIRKGEKLHEMLISEYETVYLEEKENKFILNFNQRYPQRNWQYDSFSNLINDCSMIYV